MNRFPALFLTLVAVAGAPEGAAQVRNRDSEGGVGSIAGIPAQAALHASEGLGPADVDRILAAAQCGACHALPAGANGLAIRSLAPDLSELGKRMGPGALRAFLSDPAALRPHTRMPDILGGLPVGERRVALDALADLLLGPGAAQESLAEAVHLEFSAVESGRQLYHRLGCVACHGAFEEPATLELALWEFEDPLAPPQQHAARTTVDAGDPWHAGPPLDGLHRLFGAEALARFLRDPLAARPYGFMPDMGLSAGESKDLAHYLLFEAGARAGLLEMGVARGLHYAYFEGDFLEEGPPAFDTLPALSEGRVEDLATLPEHRPELFGLRYTGSLTVPVAGTWTFALTSDDGSWLWIDGAPVVANGGAHGPQTVRGQVFLEAGAHSIEVRFFEWTGGELLDVRWRGPGWEEEQTIPVAALESTVLRLKPERGEPRAQDGPQPRGGVETGALKAQGAAWFRRLGCVSCHALEGVERGPAAPTWESLGAGIRAARGCLSADPRAGLPRYRESLVGPEGVLTGAALRARERGVLELDGRLRLHSHLAALGCTACHGRRGVGAPNPARRRYFALEEGVDLGEEGRIPPQLDGVGWKLKQDWLGTVLAEGRKVRPYMLTRMPRFGAINVGELPELFASQDRSLDESPEPPFSKQAVLAAQTLLGTDGLGCVQCHDFAGYGGLGVPAVDLADTTRRLRWPWFRALLTDPGSLNMNTRMPSFWTVDGRSPVGELWDGNAARQIEALWSGLSLGANLPLPTGLALPEGTYELIPQDEALLVSVFWKGASARTTLVGYPERLHVAFDVEHSRLVCAWRGRFFDARGTWMGRAGQLEEPPSGDVLTFPDGAPFAVLASPDEPWPVSCGRAVGWRARGRSFDADRRPTFSFGRRDLGDLVVRESPAPFLAEGGAWLKRSLHLSAAEPPLNLWMRVARAPAIEVEEDGGYTTSSGQLLRIAGARTLLRRSQGASELLVEVPWTNPPGDQGHTAAFRVEIWWPEMGTEQR